MGKELRAKFTSDLSAERTRDEDGERRKSERACSLCGRAKLLFEPPVLFCGGPGCSSPPKRIRRNAHYYAGGSNRYRCCGSCYDGLDARRPIELGDVTLKKDDLTRRKNDEVHEEGWVRCDSCEGWVHQICGLFNTRQDRGPQSVYNCPRCLPERAEEGREGGAAVEDGAATGAEPSRRVGAAVPTAEDLPRTKLSEFLERHLREKFEERRKVLARRKAEAENIPYEEALKITNMGGPITIRQVTSTDRKLKVRERMRRRYAHKNYPEEFPFRCKCIVAFQKLDAIDVILFALYVYEHGEDNPLPNKRTVYISYLDSVHFMRPRNMRTFVYHEILIAYLDYVRGGGFAMAHIWACPPLNGDDYIFYAKPEDQKTPKDGRLRQWYLDMLVECQRREIVGKITNMHDLYFANEKLDATAVPYVDGDYFPGEAENVIRCLEEGRGGGSPRKKKRRRKSGGSNTSKSSSGGGSGGSKTKKGDACAAVVAPSAGTAERGVSCVASGGPAGNGSTSNPQEGAHFPGEAEIIIKYLEEGRGGKGGSPRKKKKKKKSGGSNKSKSSSGGGSGGSKTKKGDACGAVEAPSAGTTERENSSVGSSGSAGNGSIISYKEGGRDPVMAKLGAIIEPMKESFLVAFLNCEGASGENLVVPKEIKEYREKAKQEKESAALSVNDTETLVGKKGDIKGNVRVLKDESNSAHSGSLNKVIDDDAEELDCEFFNNRQAFLNLCRGNHYQFDELRRAKHTSMMVLWHFHNRDAPMFVQQCASCNREILTGTRHHCTTCVDFDLCDECPQNPDANRETCTNKLETVQVEGESNQGGQSGGRNQLTEAQRRERQRKIQLIEHASRCSSLGCTSSNCAKMKSYLKHGSTCKLKASGGCKICKRIWTLLRIHAQRCRKQQCPIPQCMAIRDRIRQLTKQQQAMDDRRRREMNRHYRLGAGR